MLAERWRLQLFGGLRASQGEVSIQRFRTRKAGLLLAYLAYYGHRAHPREELIDMLWPEAELETGRPRLRLALNSLRKQLEPPGVEHGSVLVTDGDALSLHPAAFQTDVFLFESALKAAEQTTAPSERRDHLICAADAYQGRLLAGFYEDWVSVEQSRLEERYRQGLHQLIETLMQTGNLERALDYGHRVVGLDPLDEMGHQLLIRVYLLAGQVAAAQRQYQELEQRLREQVGAQPSAATRHLLAGIAPSRVPSQPVSLFNFPSSQIASSITTAPNPVPASSEMASAVQEQILKPGDTQPIACLPVPLTRFFGRETELMQVVRLLFPARDERYDRERCSAQRLVTLTGPGGTGKTRLAIEVARHLNREVALPVTFVPLADVMEPDRILEAIARALALPSLEAKNLLEEVIQALSEYSRMLVLDNFEQLLPANDSIETSEGVPQTTAISIVQMLLERVPVLSCLVTSRQSLDLEGEQEFPVSPLPTPAHGGTPERLLEFPSVKLFVNRAQLAQPDFQLTSQNAEVIGRLCAQLEGLPLALELAAAWVSTLSPAQIQARLVRRFDLLVGRRKGRVSRHHSLRAALDWSYHLLAPELQKFLAQLAVFRGGWTVEAAEIVCAEPQALHYLRALRHRSLVEAEEQIEPNGEAPLVRFRLLETLREFAWEQLCEAERASLAEQHAHWCLERLKRNDFQLSEQDNDRTAHNWARSQPAHEELYFQLLGGLVRFWRARGWWREGLVSLEVGLERDRNAYPELYGILCHGAALMAFLLKDMETALGYYRQALVLFTDLGDSYKQMHVWNGMGCAELGRGTSNAARQNFLQALQWAETLQNDGMAATIHGNLGYVALNLKDWPSAQEHMEQCLHLHKSCNMSEAWPLQNLGALAQAQEKWAQARAYFEESLIQYRQINETYRIAEVLDKLSTTLERCGDLEGAARCRVESEALSLQLHSA